MSLPFVITGGGSGIGRALTLALSHKGYPVIIIGRNQATLEETNQLSSNKVKIIVADIANEQGRNLVLRTLSAHKNLAGIIHNAGVVTPFKPIAELTLEDWRSVQAINVEAPLFLTQGLLTKLKGGRVVHLSSGARYLPLHSWSPYCVSKASLHMLWQCLQTEVSEVHFASVCPGIVDTPMMDTIRADKTMPKALSQFYQNLYENTQLVTPAMVASFICWLLLEVNDEMFGQQEWDIYDSTHHTYWAQNFVVPELPQ